MSVLLSIALSQHLFLTQEYNSFHPAIQIHKDMFVAGTYYNSEYNISHYAGIKVELNNWSLEAGLTTGYQESSITPLLKLTYELQSGTSLFIIPAYERENSGVVIGLQKDWKLFK